MGSLASASSKDSSLNAPGYFAALVASLTYVDEHGEARPAWQISSHVCVVLRDDAVACSMLVSAAGKVLPCRWHGGRNNA